MTALCAAAAIPNLGQCGGLIARGKGGCTGPVCPGGCTGAACKVRAYYVCLSRSSTRENPRYHRQISFVTEDVILRKLVFSRNDWCSL